MIRIFRHYVPRSLAALGFVEMLFLLFAVDMAARLRFFELGLSSGSIENRLLEDLTFVLVTYVAMLAVGLYQLECCRDARTTFVRLIVAWVFAFVGMSVIFYSFPDVSLWRSISFYALLIGFFGILVIRYLFSLLVDHDALKRRILVLGAGRRAAKLGELERSNPNGDFTVVDYVRMRDNEMAIEGAIPRENIEHLSGLIDRDAISEVVLALDERRGALPVADLLEARLRGTRITEVSDFLERQTGRVDLETLRPSIIIFSDDFRVGSRINLCLKRLFDIMAALLLLLFSFPILLVAAAAIKLSSPGPVFFRQTRVGQFGATFNVLKFRSMREDAEKDGKPRWADAQDSRVTPVGRMLRATRIDEIPQIFNVLAGQMSFVGPRPERPFFVENLTKEIPFYAERHSVKPGITGWAQLNYPYGASVEDARAKLEYDLYYVKNYSIFLDILILIQTVRVVIWQDGVR